MLPEAVRGLVQPARAAGEADQEGRHERERELLGTVDAEGRQRGGVVGLGRRVGGRPRVVVERQAVEALRGVLAALVPDHVLLHPHRLADHAEQT